MLIFLFQQAINLVKFRLSVLTYLLCSVVPMSIQFSKPLLFCLYLSHMGISQWSLCDLDYSLLVTSLLKVFSIMIRLRSMHAQLWGEPRDDYNQLTKSFSRQLSSPWFPPPNIYQFFWTPLFIFITRKLGFQLLHPATHICEQTQVAKSQRGGKTMDEGQQRESLSHLLELEKQLYCLLVV